MSASRVTRSRVIALLRPSTYWTGCKRRRNGYPEYGSDLYLLWACVRRGASWAIECGAIGGKEREISTTWVGWRKMSACLNLLWTFQILVSDLQPFAGIGVSE